MKQRPPLSRWEFETIFAAVALLAITLSLLILGRHAGWPRQQGQDTILTEVYTAHFRQLDFFPIWSSSDAYGMGSPMPLYYSRLFFSVSGLIFLVTGQIKLAMILSTALFMIVGVYGMRFAVTIVTQRRLLITVGAIALIFTNYSFTDWLVRGDFGEFSAMMLAPWLLWWCLKLVTARRASFALIPIIGLLILAHIAIAVISVLVFLVALVIFFAIAKRNELIRAAGRLGVCTLGLTLLLSPLLVTVVRFSANFDPASKITKLGFEASQNVVQTSQYFYDSSFQWSTTLQHYRPFVQIDFAIWIPIALASGCLLAVWVAKRRWSALGTYFHLPTMVFVFGSLAVLMLFQLPISQMLYRAVPPLQDIQFPWRMLAFIAPLGIIAVIEIGEAAARKAGNVIVGGGLPILWLASLVVLSPVFSSVPSRSFTPRLEALPHHLTYGEDPLLIDGYNGEYLPLVKNENWLQTLANYQYLFSTDREAQPISAGNCTIDQPTDWPFELIHVRLTVACGEPSERCTIREPNDAIAEALQMRLSVTCNRPTELALPVTSNDFTRVFVIKPNGHARPVTRVNVPTDPRIIIRVTSTKQETYLIELPTLWRVLF